MSRDPTVQRRAIADRIEAAKSVDLAALIGQRVALKQHGHEYTGLCPFHNEKSGSFTVRPDKRFYHCFGCGAHGSAIDWVIAFEKCDVKTAVEIILGGRSIDAAEIQKIETGRAQRDAEARSSKQQKIARAWRRWERARPIVPGDPVWRYLQGRGCLTSPVPQVLRFDPAMWHREYFGADGSPSRTWAAMLARVDSKSGEFSGMHMTYLVDAGEGRFVQDPELKARGVSKLTVGDVFGGAIRLFDSSGDLNVGEGIEDSLSVYCLGGQRARAVWAMPAHGHMARFEIPQWVSSLGIYAHRDKPQTDKVFAPEGVGMRSARKLQDRAREQQIDARVYWPSEGLKDFNDVLLLRRVSRSGMRAGSVEATVLT
jgi:hypothetical protein